MKTEIKVDIRSVNLDEGSYPENLRDIHGPPESLRVAGAIIPGDRLAIAVVGSRRASPYGLETAERLAYELAGRGVTVVSGLAIGIDTAAHKGALDAGGRTIAVLGSGHGHVYPPQNVKLYERIAQTAAVVTEFEDDEKPLPYHFPQRNRIISGLSLGVVVVEAARDSGALITADFALEQGREVFAVPGNVSRATSGTHRLIKEGAKLVESADDILEEIRGIEILPAGKPPQDRGRSIERMTNAYIYNALTLDERKVYKALGPDPVHIDDIVDTTDIGRAKVTSALLSLVIKKVVSEMPGKRFAKKAVITEGVRHG